MLTDTLSFPLCRCATINSFREITDVGFCFFSLFANAYQSLFGSFCNSIRFVCADALLERVTMMERMRIFPLRSESYPTWSSSENTILNPTLRHSMNSVKFLQNNFSFFFESFRSCCCPYACISLHELNAHPPILFPPSHTSIFHHLLPSIHPPIHPFKPHPLTSAHPFSFANSSRACVVTAPARARAVLAAAVAATRTTASAGSRVRYC